MRPTAAQRRRDEAQRRRALATLDRLVALAATLAPQVEAAREARLRRLDEVSAWTLRELGAPAHRH